jgi:MFS family permease
MLNRSCIGYAFGFMGIDEKATSFYMLSKAYPQITKYYGIVSSVFFACPYSILGIFSGLISAKLNRKIMLGAACSLFSLATFCAGSIDSFIVFCLMRICLGSIASGINPPSYSLITDYFPPSYRATANAIESSGTYVGSALASISVVLISLYGWRVMYQIIGVAGIISGLAAMVLIKEPPRGDY